jgi:hypothetical protein
LTTHPHHLRGALSAAGDGLRDAVVGLAYSTHHPHWEEALADYERTHPEPPAAAPAEQSSAHPA